MYTHYKNLKRSWVSGGFQNVICTVRIFVYMYSACNTLRRIFTKEQSSLLVKAYHLYTTASWSLIRMQWLMTRTRSNSPSLSCYVRYAIRCVPSWMRFRRVDCQIVSDFSTQRALKESERSQHGRRELSPGRLRTFGGRAAGSGAWMNWQVESSIFVSLSHNSFPILSPCRLISRFQKLYF